ncbi:HotDog domain-containing protein [Aspergillus carlsbadensis]|nr:HotDog domain-containing protein [Aspergillus carlsbadensis]
MRSRAVTIFPTYLPGWPHFCCPRTWTGYRPNEGRYNSVRKHAARQSRNSCAGFDRQPLSRAIRPFSSKSAPTPPFIGVGNKAQQTAEDLISSLPITRYLRSLSSKSSPKPIYTESRPYRDMHPEAHTTHLVSASLLSPTKLPTDPIFFLQTNPEQASLCNVIATCYIGDTLCGHPGYVHGGLSFVLFDDVFARSAAAVLKSRTAMTASMSVDFRAPAAPNRVYVYRAKILEKQGRKVWLQGEMRCLREFNAEEMARRDVAVSDGVSCEEMEGTLVAEARALFVEPKNMEAMVPLYPV